MIGTTLAHPLLRAGLQGWFVQMRRVLVASAVLFFLVPLVPAPAGAEPIGMQWPQPGGKGSPVVITYSYSNLLDGAFLLLTPGQLRAATEEGFGVWARFAPLVFVERPDWGPSPSDKAYRSDDSPQIRIGHHEMTDWAHAYYPGKWNSLAGDIHLATGAPWSIGTAGGWNYLEVITHEIGHALGLGHELRRDAMMNPFFPRRYSGLGSAYLLPADITDIRAVYGAGSGSVQPLAPVPEPGTWLLTSAGIVAIVRRMTSRLAHRG